MNEMKENKWDRRKLDGSLLPEQVEQLCLGLTADDLMILKDYYT